LHEQLHILWILAVIDGSPGTHSFTEVYGCLRNNVELDINERHVQGLANPFVSIIGYFLLLGALLQQGCLE